MRKTKDHLKTKKFAGVCLGAMVLGLVLFYGLKGDENQPLGHHTVVAEAVQHAAHDHASAKIVETAPGEQPPVEGGKTESEVLYVCPMNHVPPMEKPGRCPVCGMDLVMLMDPRHAGGAARSRLALAPESVIAAGIQVAPVEEKFVTAEIRLYGKIEYDPVEQYKVTAFAPGVVDNIYVKRAGQAVRKGDPLFDLHSSDLFFLEEEFFEVLKDLPYELDLRPAKFHSRKRVGRWTRLLLPPKTGEEVHMDEEEKKAFKQRLDRISRKMKLLGLTDDDIEGLMVKGRATGIVSITTPMTGVVLEQNAFRGAFVNTGDVIFTIANPRVLWARLDAYASDFPWIRLGQEAVFETDAYPGIPFTGKVVYIDPEFDPKSRVFKVGVLYNDSKGLLKPNMLVRAEIRAELTSGGQTATELLTQGMMGTTQMKREHKAPLVIPDSAPLITGKRAVVYVEVWGKPGTFEGREILLGPRAKGYYLVHAGLAKGEMVVVNGNFKIDSAVQILAKPSMMQQKGGKLAAAHYHHVASPMMDHAHRSEDEESRKPGDGASDARRDQSISAIVEDTGMSSQDKRAKLRELLRAKESGRGK